MIAVARSPWYAPQFQTGSIELLKWFALAAMLVDHVDAFFYGRSLGTDVGRLVFPIFGFVLAYNLARPSSSAAVRVRLVNRLLLFAVLAMPAHVYLLGGAQLNIMATFAVFVGIVHLLRSDSAWAEYGAMLLFSVGGAAVEYNWPGLAFCFAVWNLYRNPTPPALAFVVAACASLVVVNGSHWALLALPLLWLAQSFNPSLSRDRWTFYVFYPAHLVVIAAALWWA